MEAFFSLVSVRDVDKTFSARLALNRSILQNRYWVLPYDDTGHRAYVPVGRGEVSSDFCGRYVSVSVCKNVDAHKGVVIDGFDYTGKVVASHNHMWCKKSSCPICFNRGWAVFGARKIEGRINEGVNRGLGDAEHISVSVPVVDRDLPESVLRVKCRNALLDRGVTGGCMIFHGYRMNKQRDCLVWSPHYHCIGSIKGGFDSCRGCVHNREDCVSCDGFKGREVRGFKRDGYLVKVYDKRKTIFGTAHYQLNHATIRLGIKRFHTVTWFGSYGYRKFRGLKLKSEKVCPICQEEMVRCVYVGSKRHVTGVGEFGYVPLFADDEFGVDGEPNYLEVAGCRDG
jgi:hypothetical protein